MARKIILTLLFLVFVHSFSIVTVRVYAKTLPKRNLPISETTDKANKIKVALDNKKSYIDGEILIKYKRDKIDLNKNFENNNTRLLESNNGLKKKEIYKEINLILYETNTDINQLIKKIQNDPIIEYAEPNYIKKFESSSNDTYFSRQWALDNTGQTINTITGKVDADVDIQSAWNFELSSQQNVTIAILDTGVYYDNSDITTNMWDGTNCRDENNSAIPGGCPFHGWNYYTDNNNPDDYVNHGTPVAGIIAAITNNSYGLSGLSYYNHIKIMAIKFAGSNGGLISDEIKGINFAKNNGASVINMSVGGYDYNQAEKDAIDNFSGLIIASACNEGMNNDANPCYPASYNSTNIISVTGTDQNDNFITDFNYGLNTVDIGAPGWNVSSLSYLDDYFSEYDGTSFAASYVAGAAALVLALDGSLTTNQVKDLIINNGDIVPSLVGKTVTGKRLNLYNTVLYKTYNSKGPVYRFWNQIDGDHFYTINDTETTDIINRYPTIWKYEGVSYNAFSSSISGTTPLYRFWNLQNGQHFYTISAVEKDWLLATYPSIWQYEGIAYYVYSSESNAVNTFTYRFWNLQNGQHFYTTSAVEKDWLITTYPSIWQYEGIAFKVP